MRYLDIESVEKPTILDRLSVFASLPTTFYSGLLIIGVSTSAANKPGLGFFLAVVLAIGQWCLVEFHP